MKKSILFAALLVGAAFISACKKDRVCRCTTETTGSINSTSSADTTLKDMTRSEAKDECESFNSSGSAFGVTWDQDCELQ